MSRAGCAFVAAAIAWARIASAAEPAPKPPEPPPAPELPAAFGWNAQKQGRFPVCIASSPRGEVWVGTEGNGIWRYSPSAKKWTGYTTQDGLGDDDVYAVAIDQLGRVWAGHLNHGVSVFNGKKWRNYTSLEGPLGDRVFAIATCPTDGDVWIATDCGLARYSLKRDDWDYYTCGAGLPSNQIQALTFDPDGNVFVGTQCDGVAVARAEDGYRTWKTVSGPRTMPNTPVGEGLPSNLINAMVFDPNDNSINAITPLGLGGTEMDGMSWVFVRGEDWEPNVLGRYKGPDPRPEQVEMKLPLEDWITAIAIEGDRVWFGYRQRGFDTRDDKSGEPVSIRGLPSDVPCEWVRAISLAPKLPPLLAIYDAKTGGLKTVAVEKAFDAPEDVAAATTPAFPSPAKPPGVESLKAMQKFLDGLKLTLKPGEGVFLGDDWRTQGDWVGRYGRRYARLFGAAISADHIFAVDSKFNVSMDTGPHFLENHKGFYRSPVNAKTEDLRVLYSPWLGYRRDAEINDGSWQAQIYPFDWEGPDLFVKVTVPEGAHRVSLYFVNSEAHTGQNKFRDYEVELWPKGDVPFYDEAAVPLAHARVTDFAGGVYKQFAVRGPGEFQFRIARNRSFSTRLQGVFIDPSNATGDHFPLPAMGGARYDPADPPEAAEKTEIARAAVELWGQLDAAFVLPGAAGLQQPFRMLAYRAAASAPASAARLANWRWHLQIWTAKDREEFKAAMDRGWKAFLEKNPDAAEPAGGK